MPDVIEDITGESLEELREHEWPSAHSTKEFFAWPGIPPRGSFLLSMGLVVDSDKLARKRQRATSELLASLPPA